MMATAMDLTNMIRVNGSVMVIWEGEALEVDRCVRTRDAIFFQGVNRFGDPVDFGVTSSTINDNLFVTTTKEATNWPW